MKSKKSKKCKKSMKKNKNKRVTKTYRRSKKNGGDAIIRDMKNCPNSDVKCNFLDKQFKNKINPNKNFSYGFGP